MEAEALIGYVLADRYIIEDILGHQKGRRTFSAFDSQCSGSVVMKLLLFGPDFTWDDLKLFEREAEVLKSLNHPALATYLDSFEVETPLGKGFALVQSYIDADSIQTAVKAGRTWSEGDLMTIAKDMLGILDYLHTRQPSVIHRDIKPSNILLGDRSGNHPGQVYLIDFGSVQTVEHGGTRTVVGTYGYMPPEQFGGRTTPASDLYALGATLIYLATGQHPDHLLQQETDIEFEIQLNLSPHFIDWLKLMTEVSLSKRLQSAQQALIELETPRNRKPSFALASRPVGSKVSVTQTPQKFEILIPFYKLSLGLVVMTLFTTLGLAIFLTSTIFLLLLCLSSPTNTSAALSLAFYCGLMSIGFIALANYILFNWFGKERLKVTQSKISISTVLFGRDFSLKIFDRQEISIVELSQLRYADNGAGTYPVPPAINIWTGETKISLDQRKKLTHSERQWLAQEISGWMDVPLRS